MSTFSLPTPYAMGYADGIDGTPYQRDAYRFKGSQLEYAHGWRVGYHKALAAEIAAYNRLHGTLWEPRAGLL